MIVSFAVEESIYPFRGSNGHTYTPNGAVYEERSSQCDLIELIQDEHGWRPWKATKDSVCPVGLDVLVLYRMVGYGEDEALAGNLRWNFEDSGADIVSYKIVEEAQQ